MPPLRLRGRRAAEVLRLQRLARGCRFAIWKTIAGKKIGVRTAQALLRQGRSPVLKGFESKSGKPFDARLKLDGGEVRFDFGP